MAFEREALGCLADVGRYAWRLTRSRPDADDLVQDTYLNAYRSRGTFRPGGDARRWLFAICRHAFFRSQRRAWRVVTIDGETELDVVATSVQDLAAQRAEVDDMVARVDLAPAVRRALAGLPAPFRAAAVLVDVAGCAYEDAAARLGVPVGTVRSRLFRARRLLRRALETHARDAGLLPPAPAEVTRRGAGTPPPRRCRTP